MTCVHKLEGDVQDIDGKFSQKLDDAHLDNELDYMMMYLYLGLDDDDRIPYLRIVLAYEIENEESQL